MYYLFDIDGTITPSRQKITKEFKDFFLKWSKDKKVIFITGSDYNKTLEQVGKEILDTAEKTYCCMGNSCWKNDTEIFKNNWMPKKELIDFLNKKIIESTYPLKFENHIEQRTGMVNFSVLGRNCSQEERKKYYNWDKIHKEREKIQSELTSLFPELNAQIGGEISIDIIPKGLDKSQIAKFFENENVSFFADKMDSGGNDAPLADILRQNSKNKLFPVNSPEETLKILKSL